jgi:hypothetical protein
MIFVDVGKFDVELNDQQNFIELKLVEFELKLKI